MGLSNIQFFGTIHYQFQAYKGEHLKLVSQQDRAWSDCTVVQAGLALHFWERLIYFGSSRIKVKTLYTLKHLVYKQYRESCYRHNWIVVRMLYSMIVYKYNKYLNESIFVFHRKKIRHHLQLIKIVLTFTLII